MMVWRTELIDNGGPFPLPDVFLPDQILSDRCLIGQAAEELLLRWSVFADGLHQFWQMAADKACHASSEFCDEEEWLLSDDRAWPFSFVSLCEAFGFEATSIRLVLLARKNAST